MVIVCAEPRVALPSFAVTVTVSSSSSAVSSLPVTVAVTELCPAVRVRLLLSMV